MSISVQDRLRPAVFLDRDGTVNIEKEYLYRTEDFEFIPGSIDAIRQLKQAGFLVIIVTNQSGIARGFYSVDDVEVLHMYMQEQLRASGTAVDDFYFCPHHPTAGVGEFMSDCSCRKPQPGMLLAAADKWHIDLHNSYIIGDKLADVGAGKAAGCRPLLVRTGYGETEARKLDDPAISVYNNLSAAVQAIVAGRSSVKQG